MSSYNYRNNLLNLHRETRFSIPFNNTSIKRRILIKKLGLSQEKESALICHSPTSPHSSSNKGYNSTNKIAKLKSSNYSPYTYTKLYNENDGIEDDNITVYSDSTLAMGRSSRLSIRSATPDFSDDLPPLTFSPILRTKGPLVHNTNSVINNNTNDTNDNETADTTFCLNDTNDTTSVPTDPVTDENSYFFRNIHNINVRKAKSLDVDHIMTDYDFFNDIKEFKDDTNKETMLTTVDNCQNQQLNSTEFLTTNAIDDHPQINDEGEKEEEKDEGKPTENEISPSFSPTTRNKMNMHVRFEKEQEKDQTETSLSLLSEKPVLTEAVQFMEPDEDNDEDQNDDFLTENIVEDHKIDDVDDVIVNKNSVNEAEEREKEKGKGEENEVSIDSITSTTIIPDISSTSDHNNDSVKSINSVNSKNSSSSSTPLPVITVTTPPSTTDPLNKSSVASEQMLLQFVAYDEQEKNRLQQTIIDQTQERLNEKQEEADRLQLKINQQKAKIAERQARQSRLTLELEFKRRQSAELRSKLKIQQEKNQQQCQELNYYKTMNTKFMEENRRLQEQIRELTKLKYLKL